MKATSVSIRLRSNSFRLRSANTDKAPEESLKKTIEVDRLIDMVSDANPREVNAIYIFNPELALYICF